MMHISSDTGNYICIDLKSFYASVECVDRGLDPLKARLVVADKSRSSKTICLAVTPALKAEGVPGRPRLFEVERITKDFIVAPPRMLRYMQISTKIFGIYMRYVAREDVHIYSVDEVFIDVRGYKRLYKKNASEICEMLIEEIYKETGITATGGVGENIYLAKVAMDVYAKHSEPNDHGVRIAGLSVMDYRRLMWGIRPLSAFWQVGKATQVKLEKKGIYTMGDVARISLTDPRLLFDMLGVNASVLIDHAWGYEELELGDIAGYKPKSSSVSVGQVLSKPYDKASAGLVISEMTDSLVLDMIGDHVVGDGVAITVGFDIDNPYYDGDLVKDRYGRQVPKGFSKRKKFSHHTSSLKEIMGAVRELFDKNVADHMFVRRMTVAVTGIISDDTERFEQLSLFDNPEERLKEKKAQEAAVSINRRFGKGSVMKGMNLYQEGTARERNKQIGGHKA